MLASVRTEAGLGSPPKEFSTKDVESGNLLVKYHLQFDPKEPASSIQKIQELVEEQYRNEDRALSERRPSLRLISSIVQSL